MTEVVHLPRRDETGRLLERRIDDLLLQARGLALVRDLLETRGASRDEIAAHSRELERVRATLAELIGGPTDA